MAKEIERKFLVDLSSWENFKKNNSFDSQDFLQAYISRNEKQSTRVRIKSGSKGQKAYLTMKGNTKGITRTEFEYEIPLFDAKSMIDEFCDKFIDKKRYTFTFKNKVWEVDEFTSPKAGLVLAEVELLSEEESFEKPNFVLDDVSDDPQYFNINML